MTNRKIVPFIMTVMLLVPVLCAIPQPARALASGMDSIAELDGDTFYVTVYWMGFEYVEARLYFNGVLVESNEYMYYAPDPWDYRTYIDYSPAQKGTYKIQLWSEDQTKEIYSKEWVLPTLELETTVSPTAGQIGTMFVVTTTFSVGLKSPDLYSFSGSLEISASTTTLQQNVGGTLISDHYYTFYKLQAEDRPIFTSTGFTFSKAGTYSVGAKYTDTMSSISSPSINVVMEDQYQPNITALQATITTQQATITTQQATIGTLETKLATTNDNLTQTKSQLSGTNAELSTTNAKLSSTQSDLETTTTLAYVGLIFGILGMVIGIVGVVMALKAKKGPTPTVATSAAQSPPPPAFATAPQQQAPAAYAQPGQAYQQPQLCAKCGGPMNGRTCSYCGAFQ